MYGHPQRLKIPPQEEGDEGTWQGSATRYPHDEVRLVIGGHLLREMAADAGQSFPGKAEHTIPADHPAPPPSASDAGGEGVMLRSRPAETVTSEGRHLRGSDSAINVEPGGSRA